jgi:hypothetical protein
VPLAPPISVRDAGAGGSNPLTPTNYSNRLVKSAKAPEDLASTSSLIPPPSRARAAGSVRCCTPVGPQPVPHRTWCGRADDHAIPCDTVRCALALSLDGHTCGAGYAPSLARVRRRRTAGGSSGAENHDGYEANPSHAKHLSYRGQRVPTYCPSWTVTPPLLSRLAACS